MAGDYHWYDPSSEQKLGVSEQIAAEGGPPAETPGAPAPDEPVILTTATAMILDGGGA